MIYLEIDEVWAIHEEVLRTSGGREGILDFTLLHSAVERPKATFAGEDLYPTVFIKAAALLHSLIQNHPFLDGNKRTAFVTTARFLYLNGCHLVFREAESVDFVLAIQKKKTSFPSIAAWLKKHSRKIRKTPGPRLR